MIGALITKGKDVGKNGSIFAKASLQCLHIKIAECEEGQGKAACSGISSPPYSALSRKLNSLLKMSVEMTLITLMFRMMQITAGSL